jgi:hypothetical protein
MRNCFDVTYAKKILHLLKMMQTTRIQDPSFQTQHSGKCDLLIELLPQACRYAVLDIGQDQLKIVGEAANFDAFAKEDVLSSFYYRKVKVAVHTNKFTYIPEDLFETAHMTSYGKFIQANEDEDVLTQLIKAAKCIVVFAVEKTVLTAVHQGVHQPHFYHASSPLIEAACKFNKKVPAAMRQFLSTRVTNLATAAISSGETPENTGYLQIQSLKLKLAQGLLNQLQSINDLTGQEK